MCIWIDKHTHAHNHTTQWKEQENNPRSINVEDIVGHVHPDESGVRLKRQTDIVDVGIIDAGQLQEWFLKIGSSH